MFEIEKNFDVDKEKIEKLIEGAKFLGIKVFTDIYYDNANYDVTKRDIWLRMREGRFEAKVSIGEDPGIGDRYNEIESDDEIKKLLGIGGEGNLKELLMGSNYFPFASLKTTRKKYKKEGFNIDIDFAEFDDGFTFSQMEIELMIEDRTKAEETAKKIIHFAAQYGLKEINMGKVSEYLKNKKPEHYKVLADLGFWPGK